MSRVLSPHWISIIVGSIVITMAILIYLYFVCVFVWRVRKENFQTDAAAAASAAVIDLAGQGIFKGTTFDLSNEESKSKRLICIDATAKERLVIMVPVALLNALDSNISVVCASKGVKLAVDILGRCVDTTYNTSIGDTRNSKSAIAFFYPLQYHHTDTITHTSVDYTTRLRQDSRALAALNFFAPFSSIEHDIIPKGANVAPQGYLSVYTCFYTITAALDKDALYSVKSLIRKYGDTPEHIALQYLHQGWFTPYSTQTLELYTNDDEREREREHKPIHVDFDGLYRIIDDRSGGYCKLALSYTAAWIKVGDVVYVKGPSQFQGPSQIQVQDVSGDYVVLENMVDTKTIIVDNAFHTYYDKNRFRLVVQTNKTITITIDSNIPIPASYTRIFFYNVPAMGRITDRSDDVITCVIYTDSRSETDRDIRGECITAPQVRTKIACESEFNECGGKKGADIWDARCSINTECPFYDVLNQRGGCTMNGYCEMPLGVEQVGYTKYTGAPYCQGCQNDEPECCLSKIKPVYVFT